MLFHIAGRLHKTEGQMMAPDSRSPSAETVITVKELATILRDWIVETVTNEIDGRGRAAEPPGESLGTMLQPQNAAAKRVRARRFREALAGLETMLVGERELEYRPVLDHILHNIGASLQALDLFTPEAGLIDPPQFDFRRHASFPAIIAPRRYVPLPRTTDAMHRMGFARYWAPQSTLYLTEYREWQPRFLRGPAHDDERFGLFAWHNLSQRDVIFFPLSRVPGAVPTGMNEIVMLGQRTSMLGRLFDSAPRHEEHVARLTARDFTFLLRALLLDYEALHTARQREVAEQDQLGVMLWDFLSRDQ